MKNNWQIQFCTAIISHFVHILHFFNLDHIIIQNLSLFLSGEQLNPHSLKEVQVKIADLGSSCWVVSLLLSHTYYTSLVEVVWKIKHHLYLQNWQRLVQKSNNLVLFHSIKLCLCNNASFSCRALFLLWFSFRHCSQYKEIHKNSWNNLKTIVLLYLQTEPLQIAMLNKFSYMFEDQLLLSDTCKLTFLKVETLAFHT